MPDKDSLRSYIDEIRSNKTNNHQFNNIQMDVNNCKIILKHLNATSSINAHPTIMTAHEFANSIDELNKLNSNEHKRFVINAGDNRTHFASANVFKDVDNNISIIFVDSSRGKNQFILFILYSNLVLNNVPKIKTLYIYNQIQNSDADCLLFSLHFLKKMHKYSDHFVKLHQDLFNNKIEFIREEHSPYESVLDNDSLKKARVVFFDQAIKLLPIDFFKHAQSMNLMNTYNDYAKSHFGEINKDMKANKQPGGRETLIDRCKRHEVTRTIDEKKRTYSNSIEEKRLSLAEAALHWLDKS
ncbi:YopJ family acetyltransferase [Xenorhabdus ehlersii]|uniref:Type III secretion system effector VopA, acetyltransferase n=1 Tax=Xenorhabdus ehlersii TaxID=290111 RepID=A0A2D0IZH8_9GAMM|nr:YopJ family acetyltransferase [Xenorhabdus ehlersii]PHM27175.1 type III secretion system effector VopA, acetyltransferase [Xenorhabdus ehlersii]RKE92413.1 YopJ family protease [Xenorhabdus ehlersii]